MARSAELNKTKIRTMAQLSETIGISRPTLSKYFQDSGSVHSKTRVRIEEALCNFDYVPNYFATNMNRRSTRTIGVIVPYLNDPFFTTLIQSIEKSALQHGYAAVLHSAHGDSALEEKALQNMAAMCVDGVIAAPIGQSSSHGIIDGLKQDVPIVFIDSRCPGSFNDIDFVGTNNQQSISLIVEYLHGSGAPPVFFGMPRLNSNSLEREKAYLSSAKKLRFKPEIIPVQTASSVWNFEEFAFETMDKYFARGEYADSTVLCANDRLAIGVLRAANKHHLLPNKSSKSSFRVAGHDDHPLSAYVYPALTTVSRNTDGMGQAAVEQIFDQIINGKRDGQGVVRTFNAELRLRESA
ncbi:MAG: LacI family DNA-binding transcriptional regulator [Granulosicoccus sp.]